MSKMDQPDFDLSTYLATCARGLERILVDELVGLGITRHKRVPGGVLFKSSIEDAMRACMWLRTAERVLLKLGADQIRNDNQLYPSVRRLPIAAWAHPDHSIVVHARTSGRTFKDSRWVALRTKDAIVDAVRDRWGRRPNVDKDRPAVAFFVSIRGQNVEFYVELHGEPLYKRNRNQTMMEAPLRETLAAALLLAADYEGKGNVHDPFCGSGTIVFEAASIATDTAPGLKRRFGFERWPTFNGRPAQAWSRIKEEAQQRAQTKVRSAILGTDRDREAVEIAKKNAERSGFEGLFIAHADARDIEPLIGGGLIVTNPPYGERLDGTEEGLTRLYEKFGKRVLAFEGHKVAMIAPPLLWLAFDGEPYRETEIMNGPIKCTFGVLNTSEQERE